MQQVANLLDIVNDFEAAGIDVLCFKGPALSQRLYGEPIAREFGDVDILVRDADVERGRAILHEKGFEERPKYEGFEAYARRYGNDREYFRGHMHVEMHWRILPLGWMPESRQPDVWADTQTVTLGGRTVRTLGDATTLDLLLLHGGKHDWYRIGWLADLARMLEQYEPDWDVLLERARRRRTLRLVLVGLWLAHDVIGSAVPASVLERCRRDAKVERLAKRCMQSWHRDGRTGRVVHSMRQRLATMDSWLDRLRYLAFLAFVPKPSDHAMLRFPRILQPAYWLLRPALIVVRGLTGRKTDSMDL